MKEEWRICPRNAAYLVSNVGRVYSRKTKRILKAVKSNGYLNVTLCIGYGIPKPVGIHVLVAEAFIENKSGKKQVNHIDGNKQNNIYTNLEWVTPSENNFHAYKTSLWNKEKSFKPVRLYILNEWVAFESMQAVAEYLGCTKSAISYACNTSGHIHGLPIEYV